MVVPERLCSKMRAQRCSLTNACSDACSRLQADFCEMVLHLGERAWLAVSYLPAKAWYTAPVPAVRSAFAQRVFENGAAASQQLGRARGSDCCPRLRWECAELS